MTLLMVAKQNEVWNEIFVSFFFFIKFQFYSICLQFLDIGVVTSIECNHKQVETARKGQEVCIKIDPIPGESPKMFGRHFDETDILTSKVSSFFLLIFCFCQYGYLYISYRYGILLYYILLTILHIFPWVFIC